MSKLSNLLRRKSRARYKLSSVTNSKCRLSVHRSNKHIYAQVIDDNAGITLSSISTLSKKLGRMVANVSAAEQLGCAIAKDIISKGIEEVVFDRGGYKYHGCIKALADSARNAGLKF